VVLFLFRVSGVVALMTKITYAPFSTKASSIRPPIEEFFGSFQIQHPAFFCQVERKVTTITTIAAPSFPRVDIRPHPIV
jgi:hypothetical protein